MTRAHAPAAAALIVALPVLVFALDVPIAGRRLDMRANPTAPGRRSATITLRDPALAPPFGDPTVRASLVVSAGLGAGVPVTPWDWSFDLSDADLHVKDAAEQLADLHAAVTGVPPGSSLASKIATAQANLAAGNKAQVCAMLKRGFPSEVNAQTGKLITLRATSPRPSRSYASLISSSA